MKFQYIAIIDCTNYSNKGILCEINIDAGHISRDVLNNLDARVRSYVSVHHFGSEDEGRHFPCNLSHICYFPVYFLARAQ
jgi:hypothetical protein